MKRRLQLSVAAAIIVGALVSAGAYFSSPGQPLGNAFVVSAGETAERIADRLKAGGFIRSRLFFKYALSKSGLAKKLQPGVYDLAGVKSYGEIIFRLASGELSADELTLRVIEGWNLRDIQKYLADRGYADAASFFKIAGRPASDYRLETAGQPPDFVSEFDFLKDKPAYIGLEGYLFPDTYRVYADAAPEDIVRTMLANFGRKLAPRLRSAINASGRSIFEIVTMASVIEREVRTEADRRLAADIFWRRLAIGMPMQADSTVNYATGKSAPAVSAADIGLDSPYNTYKYRGLPLGPICNPGLSAIEAAVNPQKNDYWFFLTDAAGNVYYARTLAEHNRNKAKYLSTK